MSGKNGANACKAKADAKHVIFSSGRKKETRIGKTQDNERRALASESGGVERALSLHCTVHVDSPPPRLGRCRGERM